MDGKERPREMRSTRHLVDSRSTIVNAETTGRREHTREMKEGKGTHCNYANDANLGVRRPLIYIRVHTM